MTAGNQMEISLNFSSFFIRREIIGSSSCLLLRKMLLVNHNGRCSAPSSKKKASRRSRKKVQRALFREKSHKEVTQESVTCPLARKKPRGGHAREFNVPSSEKKSSRRSRRNVQRARLREKSHEEVTLERVTCPLR